jgi:L-asparaginase II
VAIDSGAVPIASVIRNGVVESVHHGHLVALAADGSVAFSAGDPGAVIFSRSSLKPLQAVAMVRAGLDLDGELLALASASHSGEDFHLDGARRILARAGLSEADLQNTPDWPLDDDAALAWRSAGRAKASIAQNCSGKHAAMLATCVAAGWDTATYRDPGHPLQKTIRATVEELTGDGAVDHVAVDGCGAPLFSCTLIGLARGFARIAGADGGSAESRVAAAISAHPRWLGGTGRDVTALIGGIPGLVAKDGAEGVYAAALPDGRAVALKVLDGSQRPRPVVMAAALRALGVDAPVLEEVGRVEVFGHGGPVGRVEALLGADPGKALGRR